MKSLHERLDDRLDGHIDADPDVDELVTLAQHIRAMSQPSPIFAQRLEQKVRMHTVEWQLKRGSWWSMPPLWMRFIIATIMCLFLTTSTILAIASLKPNSPMKIGQQHSPSVISTPHLQPTAPSGRSFDRESSSRPQSSGTSTPGAAGESSSIGKSNTGSNTSSPAVAPASTPTPTPTPTSTPTTGPTVCLIAICL